MLQLTPDVDQFLKSLFERHVPETVSGTVEIMALAREVGRETMVAVRSHDAGVHAVGAFVGQKGSRVRAVIRELGGEKVTVVQWDPDLPRFILNALLPLGPVGTSSPTPSSTVDAERKFVLVAASPTVIEYLMAKAADRVRLASSLVGLEIRVVPSNQEQ